MDEKTWTRADDPEVMVRFLAEAGEDALLWRFTLACLGRVADLLGEHGGALELLSDPEAQVVPAREAARGASRYAALACGCSGEAAEACALAALEAAAAGPQLLAARARAGRLAGLGPVNATLYREERAAQADLLRGLIHPYGQALEDRKAG